MECTVGRILPVGKAHLVLGEIVQWHVRDDIYDAATGRLDMHRLRPAGRLTGNLYSHIHQIFEMKRPSANYRGGDLRPPRPRVSRALADLTTRGKRRARAPGRPGPA